MHRSLLIVLSAVAFSLVGTLAAYLDRGYSPVICACWGGVMGAGIAIVADWQK